ncbi:hypothetical protein ACFQZ4_25910 [Catellatospora coxensis]|uniref:Uncharacterized protein n=1 Tax=Catellatospora coxensis TaxID=310354 RepID=A0A8J3P934_9ACTN|nr:hypothetical protein [Catellatospora coxensis]GIG08357.1 hypothetical protein Cco03nite_50570 [Catellatospora coxensis]
MSQSASFPVEPVSPAGPGVAPARPTVVTAAAAILGLLALLHLVNAILHLAAISGVLNRLRVRAVLAGVSPAVLVDLENSAKATLLTSAAVAVIAAIVLLALAWGVWQGNRVARILTWIVCGLGILLACCGVSGAVSLGTGNVTVQGGGDPSYTRGVQALVDSFPGWWAVPFGLSSLAQVLGYIATAVLLALPAANAFFSRTRPLPPGPDTPAVPPPTTA